HPLGCVAVQHPPAVDESHRRERLAVKCQVHTHELSRSVLGRPSPSSAPLARGRTRAKRGAPRNARPDTGAELRVTGWTRPALASHARGRRFETRRAHPQSRLRSLQGRASSMHVSSNTLVTWGLVLGTICRETPRASASSAETSRARI